MNRTASPAASERLRPLHAAIQSLVVGSARARRPHHHDRPSGGLSRRGGEAIAESAVLSDGFNGGSSCSSRCTCGRCSSTPRISTPSRRRRSSARAPQDRQRAAARVGVRSPQPADAPPAARAALLRRHHRDALHACRAAVVEAARAEFCELLLPLGSLPFASAPPAASRAAARTARLAGRRRRRAGRRRRHRPGRRRRRASADAGKLASSPPIRAPQQAPTPRPGPRPPPPPRRGSRGGGSSTAAAAPEAQRTTLTRPRRSQAGRRGGAEADVQAIQTSASWLGVAAGRAAAQCGASAPQRRGVRSRRYPRRPRADRRTLMPPPRPLAAAAAPSRAGRTISGGGTREHERRLTARSCDSSEQRRRPP